LEIDQADQHCSAELNIAILVACVPPLQPLFKKTSEMISRVPRSENETWESRQAKMKASGQTGSYEMISKGKSANDTSLTKNASSMGHSEVGTVTDWSTKSYGKDDEIDRAMSPYIRKTTDVDVMYRR
jgi:hypothetical protein